MIKKIRERICKYILCHKITTYIIFVAFLIVIQYFVFVQFYAQINTFMTKGKRFTALNGDELCYRIQRLEQINGIEPLPCEYNK